MASAEIALVCGLKVRASCQDRLRVNLDANETLAKRESRYVSDALPHRCEKFVLRICYVTSATNTYTANAENNILFVFLFCCNGFDNHATNLKNDILQTYA